MKTSLVRIKKTGQQVIPTGYKVNGQWDLCLFPFDAPSKRGNLGVVQPVRSENLIDDRQWVARKEEEDNEA